MKKFLILLLMLSLQQISIISPVTAQRTSLDRLLRTSYRPLRLFLLKMFGNTGDARNVAILKNTDKLQTKLENKTAQHIFCDVRNGPGKRSKTRPTSVHRLTPGDIDIIGALGDSITAGTGIFSTKILDLASENKGVVFSVGGQSNWKEYLTIPNILKEFNKNLYGYALKDGISTDRSSKFDVAEPGAMSRDIPYEAKVLVKRMRRDPRVNMTEDWKLITIFIGANDFCGDMCFYSNPKSIINWHKRHLIKTFRYLRDNIPRLMVNVIPGPDVDKIVNNYKGLSALCESSLRIECPCLFRKNGVKYKSLRKVIDKWFAIESDIINQPEFNTEDFTVNLQSFTRIVDLPRLANENIDTTYLAKDCFHLSQKTHALAANGYWNNMLEPYNQKTNKTPSKLFETFRCPTKDHPYLSTRTNS